MASLSVVLPTYNEMALGWLPDILATLALRPQLEVLAVDNGSTDGTAEALAAGGAKRIDRPGSNRAQRLNAGIAAASAERVLLHHPRSRLSLAAIDALLALPPEVAWGGFSHRFDQQHPLLAWTSCYSNRIRMDRGGIVYLDHCLFFNRSLLAPPAVPELDIFEDTALSRRLRRIAPPRRLPQQVVTSAVRYRHKGIWRQALMNQLLKVGYAVGVSHQRMNRHYERGLGLNQHGAPDRRDRRDRH